MSVFVKKSRIFFLIAVSAVIAAVGFAYVLFEPKINLFGFTPFDESKLVNANRTVTVCGGDGQAIESKFYGDGKLFCSVDSLKENTVNAFIAIEDKRFYTHKGVDYLRVLAAAKNNILSKKAKEGASTITQQLVKNTHLSNKKTLKRKINEIRIAREIERKYSKKQILENYLNILYFGNNIYGIGAAANSYFGKDASDLDLSESALLAGIINSPATLNPFVHPEKAVLRRNLVLKRMLEQNLITVSEYDFAVAEKVDLSETNNFDIFTNKSINEARGLLSLDKTALFSDNYVLCTCRDKKITDKCTEIISAYFVPGGFTEIIVASNASGACLAYVSNSKLSDTADSLRQPGSAIKPFVCYAPAIEKKLVYPVTPILDEKIDFSGYSPENYDKKYHGWISVEQSLVHSYNVPAVKLLSANGVKYSRGIAEKFGIQFDKNDNSLALALGAMSRGVTLASLTESYMTLARGGEHTELYFISGIFDKNNRCVYRHRGYSARAVGDDTAFLITDMLTRCVNEGTAKRLKNCSSAQVAAKTGTVGTKNGNSDAYCIAYTPQYTVAVRISAYDGILLPNEVSGGTVPASIASEILGFIGDETRFNIPPSVTTVDISRTQLEKRQKIVPATANTAYRDRLSAYFSRRNMPYAYDLWFDSGLDDFDDFNICNTFVN